MYHKIAPLRRESSVPAHYVSPAVFARQMRMLRLLGFQSVRMGDLGESPLPKRPIGITFDDGYENFLRHALPALRANGLFGTVFLVADRLGGTNDWDEGAERLLDAAQVRECVAAGTEFGSHTLTHVDLPKVPEEIARCEIWESRRKLGYMLQEEVKAFCYPYGGFNDRVRGLVAEAGYRTACSTRKGVNGPEADRLALRRINVRSDTWTFVFALKLLRSLRHAHQAPHPPGL
ncbi:polysaccharide deacetylase family protein [soil metagenome]